MPFADMPVRPALLLAALAMGGAPAAALTLDEAIAAALAGNPDAVQAEARSAGARARLSQARGAALPLAMAGGSIGTGRLDPQGYFGLPAADVTPRTAMLSVEQPIFAGGRIDSARKAATAGVAGAEAGLARTRAMLAAEVATAYADAVTSARETLLRRTQLTQMREIERQAERRFAAGDSASTELQQARARRAQAEAGLAEAEGQEAGASARFAALTGLPADDLAPLPAPPAVPETRAQAVAAALATSPAIADATAGSGAAAAQARGARAERLPTVAAFAEASTIRDQFFPDYAADQAVIGIRARWVLFDGSRSGRIAEADAMARMADAAADRAHRMVQADAIAAHAAMTAARRMVSAAGARTAAADEALRATRLEVKVGMKPQLALLDAEREALDAAVARVRADGMLLSAAWQLKATAALP